MKIYNVEKTCEACPAQWSAMMDNCSVYIRYRWGVFSVEVCRQPGVHDYGHPTCDWALVYRKQIGEPYDGFMDDEKMMKLVDNIITVQDCGLD